jgi:electron transfer flavoprotein beta subunit
MGPDQKLIPLMKPLYGAEVCGVDEEYVLSDRKMAGADTLATAYAVSLGVRKVVNDNLRAMESVVEAVKKYGYSEAMRNAARQLYRDNLLPNRVYSELPPLRDTIVERFLGGKLTPHEAISLLEVEKDRLSKFIVISGMKTTDGETGSVGPQVAEAVSELLGRQIPHATYVEDFTINPQTLLVESERKIGYLSQRLEMELPAVLTMTTEYRPREPGASNQTEVRLNNYKGKALQALKWTAEDLGADPKRLGLAGSPTIVGAGIDIGKPPVQKIIGKTVVFEKTQEAMMLDGKSYGPFARGDVAGGLPETVLLELTQKGIVGPFSYAMLGEELVR